MGDDNKDLVKRLLDRHGTSYSAELGLDLAKNTPSVLFRWSCAALLMSARISAKQAVSAARALAEAGWTTAEHMAESTWKERVDVLNANGYARYDESTSRMLGENAGLLLDRYGGDLRKLRDEAGRDPDEEGKRLKDLKGIGDVGVEIFFREAQIAWDELYPFADRKSLSRAGKLGLPETAKDLSDLVAKKDFPTLLAALVRTDLAKDHDSIRSEGAS